MNDGGGDRNKWTPWVHRILTKVKRNLISSLETENERLNGTIRSVQRKIGLLVSPIRLENEMGKMRNCQHWGDSHQGIGDTNELG